MLKIVIYFEVLFLMTILLRCFLILWELHFALMRYVTPLDALLLFIEFFVENISWGLGCYNL